MPAKGSRSVVLSANCLALLIVVSCAEPKRTAPPPVAQPETAAAAIPSETPEAPPPAVPPAAPSVAPAAYVDDADCTECHAAIARSYRQVGMANSFYPFKADAAIESLADARFMHEPSRRHYEMSVRDGALFVTRYRLDESGARIHLREQRADYVIGSGNHSRGYVWRSDAGEMFQMPIVWYTQEKQWGMAPGYDRPDHEDFDRPVTRQCMFCHNAYPFAAAGHDASTTPPPGKGDAFGDSHLFPADLPHGIGCQRCHGPGSDHVRIASASQRSLRDIRSSIVNPANLPPPLAEDVCMQCHLQPTSQRTSILRRFGKGDYEYRPGRPLDEHLVHLDVEANVETSKRRNVETGKEEPAPAFYEPDRFEINHHPYRLRQSRCHVESGEGLSCLTCHDPHVRVPPDQAAAHYRSKCLSCHKTDDCHLEPTAEGRSTSDNCAACHMPKRRTQDVIHVVMTDHRIQRPSPADPFSRGLLAPLAETAPPSGGTVRMHMPDRAPGGAVGDVYRAQAAAMDGEPDAVADLQAALDKWTTETGRAAIEPYLQLGQSQLEAGRFADAAGTFKTVLVGAPDAPLARTNLGVALTALRRFDEALEHLENAVKQSPGRPDVHYNLAVVLARKRREEEAIEHYRRALALRPNHAKAGFNLGNLLARRGGFDEAVTLFEDALRIDPDFVEAYRSLGAARRRLGCWGDALATWREGVRVAPQHVGMLMELSLAYAAAEDKSVRDASAALTFADRAVRATPEDADVVLTMALALALNDRGDAALAVGRRALSLGAPQVDVAMLSAVVQHRAGRIDEAQRTYEAANEAAAAAPPALTSRRVHQAIAHVAGEACAPSGP